jgi:hypothetical protein
MSGQWTVDSGQERPEALSFVSTVLLPTVHPSEGTAEWTR